MQLVRFERAKSELCHVTTALQAKRISDISKAAEVYAIRQGDKGLQSEAHKTHIQALRIEGEYLSFEKRSVGRPKKNGYTGLPNCEKLTLKQNQITKRESVEAQAVSEVAKEDPEVFSALIDGKESIKNVVKKQRKKKETEQLKKAQEDNASKVSEKDFYSVCDLRCCEFFELLHSTKPDAVITDPPYPKEYLHLFRPLADLCVDIPIVAVMCGHSYLPEIMAQMSKVLPYRWTLCYLLPGGQSVQQWERKINTFWKPVLLFGKYSSWIGDVCRSDPNDNDKRYHEWGQSESGMIDLVKRLTKPGQTVCDPFMGAGTTAIASLANGCKFIGCDIDPKCVETSKLRIASYLASNNGSGSKT